MNNDLLKIIEEAARSGCTTLDLREKGITTLPPEIGQLTNLTSLDLYGNGLTSLPAEIGRLVNLTSLYLYGNGLTSLPAEIGRLTNLTSLDLRSNKLTSLPAEIGRLTNLTSLDLRSNKLTSLPAEIGRLVNLTSLYLYGNGLTSLPAEIGQLINLTSLDLRSNKLTMLPAEFGRLVNLITLDLGDNGLSSLPAEIGRLTNLTSLDLYGNGLTSLPAEIGQLINLTSLDLRSNKLTMLPAEFGRLVNLITLDLGDNGLTSLPAEIGRLTNLTSLDLYGNGLTSLPAEIGRLVNLTSLYLYGNELTSLPAEIGQLINLTSLDLRSNKLTMLPAEFGRLVNLTSLDLRGNELTSLPAEFGRLTNLTSLDLSGNELTSLPAEFGRLVNLTSLYLYGNGLTSLPTEIGQLTNLTSLDLGDNELTSLPAEFGRLSNLTLLNLSGNDFESPPPEVVTQGTEATLAYLRAKLEASRPVWVSKLLVVGQGDVGKTSLLRSLMGEAFEAQSSTTHGISVQTVTLAHPSQADVTMELSAWDFGGQEIYHAKHQFFLTDRSLFVVVCDARQDAEQGRLSYWLDAIKARAPESPVMIVATHSDERQTGLSLTDLRRKHPKIVGVWQVSNKSGAGIDELRTALAETASKLPLMGQVWPTRWIDASRAIQERAEIALSRRQFRALLLENGVNVDGVEVLTRWLHELGEILHYPDNPELCETVVLKPSMVSQAISRVLDSPEVAAANGVLTRPLMATIWHDFDPSLREYLLGVMHQFDLSYWIGDRSAVLVVACLPLVEPNYETPWESVARQKTIRLRYGFSTIPAGIPTWFLARSHRFGTGMQWRNGALLADRDQKNWGLVRAVPEERSVKLEVRGTSPLSFFALLKDGLETTLERFPGLGIKRQIPCPNGQNQPHHEFLLDVLELEHEDDPKATVRCPDCKARFPVARLLFGLDASVSDSNGSSFNMDLILRHLTDLKQGQEQQRREVLNGFEDQRLLLQREFTKQFKREQASIDSHCPNIFVLRPQDSRSWFRDWFRKPLELQLYCQEPGAWHSTGDRGRYTIDRPAEWLRSMTPYVKTLVNVLKFAVPILGASINAGMPTTAEDELARDIELMNKLVEFLPEIEKSSAMEMTDPIGVAPSERSAEGAGLRVLRHLLEEVDPSRFWGGLQLELTREGHYLWLCPHHAQLYSDARDCPVR